MFLKTFDIGIGIRLNEFGKLFKGGQGHALYGGTSGYSARCKLSFLFGKSVATYWTLIRIADLNNSTSTKLSRPVGYG